MTAEASRFSAIATARSILRSAATGALATLDAAGSPFSSLVAVATTFAGAPVLLLSRLALHTQNLARDSRASLLLVAQGEEKGGEAGDPLAGARISLTGKILPDPDAGSRARFLARHEEAATYADFTDFGIYRLTVEKGHLVAGFGRIVGIDGMALVDPEESSQLRDAEAGAVAHMNADHGEALRLYATRLCGMPNGAWQATGCDTEGIDLRAGPVRARLAFPNPVGTPHALRAMLVELARKARES